MNLKVDLQKVTKLPELFPIIENAEAKISFFGRPYIESPDYKDSFSLKEVSEKIDNLFKNNLSFSDADKIAIAEFSSKYSLLQMKHDNVILKSNIITKIFFIIRELLMNIFNASLCPKYKFIGIYTGLVIPIAPPVLPLIALGDKN